MKHKIRYREYLSFFRWLFRAQRAQEPVVPLDVTSDVTVIA